MNRTSSSVDDAAQRLHHPILLARLLALVGDHNAQGSVTLGGESGKGHNQAGQPLYRRDEDVDRFHQNVPL
jgi:hypothetical protein